MFDFIKPKKKFYKQDEIWRNKTSLQASKDR